MLGILVRLSTLVIYVIIINIYSTYLGNAYFMNFFQQSILYYIILPSNVRTRSHNIITHIPGCKPVAKNKSNIADYFHLLFDNVIIRIITSCTNKYIISIAGNFERERGANPRSESEIESSIRLLILAGVNRSGR